MNYKFFTLLSLSQVQSISLLREKVNILQRVEQSGYTTLSSFNISIHLQIVQLRHGRGQQICRYNATHRPMQMLQYLASNQSKLQNPDCMRAEETPRPFCQTCHVFLIDFWIVNHLTCYVHQTSNQVILNPSTRQDPISCDLHNLISHALLLTFKHYFQQYDVWYIFRIRNDKDLVFLLTLEYVIHFDYSIAKDFNQNPSPTLIKIKGQQPHSITVISRITYNLKYLRLAVPTHPKIISTFKYTLLFSV